MNTWVYSQDRDTTEIQDYSSFNAKSAQPCQSTEHTQSNFANALSVSSFQVGLSSFHQQAIHFLCADLKWACQIWNSFSAASPDLKLSLVKWVLDGWGSQQTSLKEVIHRVLKVRYNMFLWLQHEENSFPKNLFCSSQHNELHRAQCKEIEEAKIGLNIMQGWYLAGDLFPYYVKKGMSLSEQSSWGCLSFYYLLH